MTGKPLGRKRTIRFWGDDVTYLCFTESDFEQAALIILKAGEKNITDTIGPYGDYPRTFEQIWPELKKRILGV